MGLKIINTSLKEFNVRTLSTDKADSIITKVREIAAKYPNAVYMTDSGRCLYSDGVVKDGPEQVGCIIGQCVRDEVEPEDMKMWDALCKGVVGIFGMIDKRTEDIPKNVWWLNTVQQQQDCGRTWGQAVTTADGKYQV